MKLQYYIHHLFLCKLRLTHYEPTQALPSLQRYSLSLLLIRRLVDLPEDVGQHPICPVSGGGVQDAVELYDTHSLGVQDIQLCHQPKPKSKERLQPWLGQTKRIRRTI